MTVGPRAARSAGLLLVVLFASAPGARADFRPLAPWGSAGSGEGQFVTPLGIASDGAGSVYVADVTANRVQRFEVGGGYLGSFGRSGAGDGEFAGASHVAADAFGSVYVTDRDNARIEKFTAAGNFLFPWGSRGNGDGQFQAPAGVAVDPRGNVYVADRQVNRIQRFTPDGAYDLQWGETGTGDGRFLAAEDVAVDGVGDVYVLDSVANVVQKFTAEGTHLFDWGGSGSGDGKFDGPSGIASDGGGSIYVADTGNQRIQQFTSEGAFLTSFGGAGSGSGSGQLASPADVASDSTGTAYVVDQGTARIQRFAESTPPLPPPEAGKTANVKRVSGVVLVRRPGAATFKRLTKPEQLPFGSQVQTANGRARLITASDLRGGVQAASFRAGLFTIRQRREPRPVTDLILAGETPRACPRRASRRRAPAGASKRSKGGGRRLWGNGKGRFRTKGHYGAAGVRGTIWLTEDRCDGTLFRVRRGTVRVRDFVRGRTIILRAGRSYVARRPR